MTRWSRTFLRYWSLNMVFAWGTGTPTLGFSYDEREKARMNELAGSISGTSAIIWLSATVVLFISAAIAAVVGVMVPILTLAWPDPSKMPALPFMLLLFTVIALTIGFGLPAAIAVAGALADGLGGRGTAAPLPIDGAIYAKARWQIWRMMAVVCGLCVPAALLIITFDIDPGPLVFWLRIASLALFAVNGLGAWRAQARLRSPAG